MRKIIILIPVFNDWLSLNKLLTEINNNIKDFKSINFECFIVNDASTTNKPELKKPSNIKSLHILNMKKNKGHARCNAFGIRYLDKNEKFDYLILMDGDGEDRPIEIKSLVDQILKEPRTSVVAKRIKRSEGIFFQLLYQIHKIITFIFTGKKIGFGNYSCLTKNDTKILSEKPSLWSSFSGTVKKNIKNLNEVDSIRGTRYFGPSQMSIFKLLIHSFSIIAVFKYQVILRSIIFIFLLMYLNTNFEFLIISFQILIIIFNLLIFAVSKRENYHELIDSDKNLIDKETITQ